MRELVQKKGSDLRKFTLLDDKILLEYKDKSNNNKVSVHLEDLGTDIHYYAESKRQYKIIAIFFAVLLLICFISFLCGKQESDTFRGLFIISSIVICVMWFFPVKDDIYLVGGKSNLVFFRTKPSEEEVLKFIENVLATRKTHIISKYTVTDKTTNEEDFFARIGWLKNTKMITEEEFEDYIHTFQIKKLL